MIYPAAISRLNDQHTALPEIIRDFDEAQMHYRPEPGKWNAQEQIVHLVTYQPMFTGRIKLMLEADCPTFSPYKADTDPEFIKGIGSNDDDLILKLNADRLKMISLVTSIDPSNSGRQGVHLVYGQLSIAQWLEFFLLHEAHHLFAILKLLHGQKK